MINNQFLSLHYLDPLNNKIENMSSLIFTKVAWSGFKTLFSIEKFHLCRRLILREVLKDHMNLRGLYNDYFYKFGSCSPT